MGEFGMCQMVIKMVVYLHMYVCEVSTDLCKLWLEIRMGMGITGIPLESHEDGS